MRYNQIPSRRKVTKKAPWSEVVVDKHHFEALIYLSRKVRRVLGERRGDWVHLVADIYEGTTLPDAVAASVSKLEGLVDK